MKKKIFLIVGSLGAGGSERVYWLLSQYFNKGEYDVSVVFLNANETCFSTDIKGIRFIDLKSIKASKSFFKLHRLLKAQKPFAVFSTTDHINILTGMVAFFLKVPHFIARASNNPEQMKQFYGLKARFYNFFFTRIFFSRFSFIVCQTDEMQRSVAKLYGVRAEKLKVIPNPILHTPILKDIAPVSIKKKLIVVVRLNKEKGLFRLLQVMRDLPANYVLTVVGVGPLLAELKAYVATHRLNDRISFMGQVQKVSALIVQHDLMVLSSYTEGFPNVVLEALSVGVPVVSFKVDGIQNIIRDGFNGYVAEQDDPDGYQKQIIQACSQVWPHVLIKEDVYNRFSLNKVGLDFEKLIQQ